MRKRRFLVKTKQRTPQTMVAVPTESGTYTGVWKQAYIKMTLCKLRYHSTQNSLQETIAEQKNTGAGTHTTGRLKLVISTVT